MGKIRRFLSVFLAAVLVFVPLLPANSSTLDGCKGSVWDSIYPNECIISVHDGARTIAGISITENVYECNDRAYGVVISTGNDSLGWIKIKSAKPSGELAVGLVEFELWLVQQCLAWKDAYSTTLTLVGPDGARHPSTVHSNSFSYRQKLSGSINSYCFLNVCGDTRIQGSFNIPQGAPAGMYRLEFEVKSNLQLSSVQKTFTYSNQLFVAPSTLASTPSPSPSGGSSSSEMVIEGEFSICGGELKETLSAIKGFEKKLHPAHQKRIKDAMKSPQEICGLNLPVARVVCEGVYFGGLEAARSAKNKATLACNHAKKIQRHVPTLVKIKSTKAKSYNGYVFATFSFEP